MKKILLIVCLLSCMYVYAVAQKSISQIDINLVKYMPNIPHPYKMKDWKKIAKKQDSLLFNHDAKGSLLPLIWWDDTQVNYPIRSFGIPSYVGALRNMQKGNHYESLPTIGAVVGASLVGINKSNYEGNDYVSMLRQFHNKSNGLVLNSVKQQVGKTFWYEICPSMGFSMLVDLYPKKEEMAIIMQQCADIWNRVVIDLSKEKDYPVFDFTAFDFKKRKGYYNGRWKEPDAAAGIAWLQYSSWKKFGDQKYLKSAKSCMDFLQKRPASEGTFYEIMMPYGAYLAVRMNAELGTNYDELKMLNWCFDGDNSDRDGWGVMAESWENYDVYGLVGQKKWEQYAFAMNTFSHAAALVPIVKYNPAYSNSIGKWILNLANAARLFYSDEHPRNRQTSAIWMGDPEHVICYEGVRKDLGNGNFFEPFQGILATKGPYAVGDQVKHLTSLTDICPYGSAWVGMLASIVDTTNVEGILQLDCNATDFFGNKKFPTYLIYNPYQVEKEVIIKVPEDNNDLFELNTKKMIKENAEKNIKILIPAESSYTIVVIPSGTQTKVENRMLLSSSGEVIDYTYKLTVGSIRK